MSAVASATLTLTDRYIDFLNRNFRRFWTVAIPAGLTAYMLLDHGVGRVIWLGYVVGVLAAWPVYDYYKGKRWSDRWRTSRRGRNMTVRQSLGRILSHLNTYTGLVPCIGVPVLCWVLVVSSVVYAMATAVVEICVLPFDWFWDFQANLAAYWDRLEHAFFWFQNTVHLPPWNAYAIPVALVVIIVTFPWLAQEDGWIKKL